jgi:hypothetical protein
MQRVKVVMVDLAIAVRMYLERLSLAVHLPSQHAVSSLMYGSYMRIKRGV